MNENVKKLMESCDGKYVIRHSHRFPEVNLVEVEVTDPEARDIGDAVIGLYALRISTQDEKNILEKHPVKPEINWWNTGKIMNADELGFYRLRNQHLTDKLQNINDIIQKMEQGEYVIEHEKPK